MPSVVDVEAKHNTISIAAESDENEEDFEIDFDAPLEALPPSHATPARIETLRQRGVRLFTVDKKYSAAKLCFKEALGRILELRSSSGAVEGDGASASNRSNDAEIARLRAALSHVAFLQSMEARRAVTSLAFLSLRAALDRPSDTNEDDADADPVVDPSRLILESRYERHLLEAYDAAIAAVESCPLSWPEEFCEGEESDRLSRLPPRLRRPNDEDVVLYDEGDSRDERLEKAKKLVRRFMMFHHAMKSGRR